MTKEEREKKKKELLETLASVKGNIGVACKAVKIARKTFYNWQ